MTRLLLAATADLPLPDAAADPLARLGRTLRDAGHEVVHAGQGGSPQALAAVAVQEDVEVVVLLAPAGYDATALAAALAEDPRPDAQADAGDEADEVLLVLAAPEDDHRTVAERVRAEVGDATLTDQPADQPADRPADG